MTLLALTADLEDSCRRGGVDEECDGGTGVRYSVDPTDAAFCSSRRVICEKLCVEGGGGEGRYLW